MANLTKKQKREKQKTDRENALSQGFAFLEGSETEAELCTESVPKPPTPAMEPNPIPKFSETPTKSHFKAFGKKDRVYRTEAGELCPHCRFSLLEETISFSGKVCEFFVYCPNCNAYICTYQPMEHQKAFHLDEHMQKLYAGGFGSAKTYTCGMEFLSTVLQIPNSAGLIGAKTWGQVADTCLKFVTDNLPQNLVASSHQDKVSWYIDLVNGSRISAKAFDKEGKIRSANLSIIWIEEASEVDYEIFAYLLARVRNKAGFFKGKNRLKVLLSSNPDVGWLNTEFLMKSSEVFYHGNTKDRYEIPPEDKDPAKVTHISATSANIYLPPDYEANLARNKEAWWINRYLKGSFKYTEGLVYPDFMDWFVSPFQIPQHWRRITGTDFGRRDPTAHLVAALDPVGKVIYVYDEIEEPLEDKPLDYMVKRIKQSHDFPDYLLAFPHQCDPRGRNRDQVSGQSWIDAYREKGIIFYPARDCEASSIAPTIQKIATYAQNGRLKIFTNCVKLKASLSKYKYPERKVGDDKNQGELPLDKYNHLPDALRYMLAPFPQFPESPDDFHETWAAVVQTMQRPYNPLYEFTNTPSDYVSSFMDNFG
jgi:phage terminase large subunit